MKFHRDGDDGGEVVKAVKGAEVGEDPIPLLFKL